MRRNMLKGYTTALVIGVAGLAGAYVETAQAMNFGNMMNPSRWFGGNRGDRYYDDYYGGPGYGYGAPGYGWGAPGYGYGAPGYGYGAPGYGWGAPGYGYGAPGYGYGAPGYGYGAPGYGYGR